MRAKKGARGQTWYYLDRGLQDDGTRPWTPLGSNFPNALRKYAELVETSSAPAVTVPELLNDWNATTAHDRAAATLDDIRYALTNLMRFFGDPPAPVDQVETIHIRQYLDWRVTEAKNAKRAKNEERAKAGKEPLEIRPNEGAIRANREVSWLSAAWNWGRDLGRIRAQNPVVGAKRHKETGRDIYVEDDELAMILAHADEPLREAIELAYLTTQRPGDLRDMRETDIRDGCIEVEQNKTTAKLRIEIVGALADLIERIKARKAAIKGVRSLSLICNEKGQPLGKDARRYRFDKAREKAAKAAPNADAAKRIRAIQFSDLRAKGATDLENLEKAQSLLGHTKRDMTEHYVRRRRGEKVQPVK